MGNFLIVHVAQIFVPSWTLTTLNKFILHVGSKTILNQNEALIKVAIFNYGVRFSENSVSRISQGDAYFFVLRIEAVFSSYTKSKANRWIHCSLRVHRA